MVGSLNPGHRQGLGGSSHSEALIEPRSLCATDYLARRQHKSALIWVVVVVVDRGHVLVGEVLAGLRIPIHDQGCSDADSLSLLPAISAG